MSIETEKKQKFVEEMLTDLEEFRGTYIVTKCVTICVIVIEYRVDHCSKIGIQFDRDQKSPFLKHR